MLNKIAQEHLHRKYHKATSKITGMIKELDSIVDSAESEFARIEQKAKELEQEAATARNLVAQAEKFRNNLHNLFK